jgi:tetratricopeptide (TPR) repeat protein
MGERGRQSTIVGQLARVVYELDRPEEAEQLAEEAARLTAHDDAISQATWRSVRSLVFASRGELAEGERLGREALALIERTDFLDSHALALLDLAEILELAERPEEALPLVEQALGLTRQKGNVLLERRVLERLARLD